jgi:hypothetical protein
MSYKVKLGIVKSRYKKRPVYRVVALYKEKGETKDLLEKDPWTYKKSDAEGYMNKVYQDRPKNIEVVKVNKIMDVDK